MKLLNFTGRLVFAAAMLVGLTACPKSKNGSTAATPASICTLNAYGQYVNSQGLSCSPTANQCVWNGSNYVNPAGQLCSPTSQCTMNAYGQYVNSLGQSCSPYPTNPSYPYPQWQQNYSCEQWTYVYGIQYVPVILQGQLQCVRIDLLQGYTYNTNYYNYGYDYYYYYPPYSGSSCNTQVYLGSSWGYVGMCF